MHDIGTHDQAELPGNERFFNEACIVLSSPGGRALFSSVFPALVVVSVGNLASIFFSLLLSMRISLMIGGVTGTVSGTVVMWGFGGKGGPEGGTCDREAGWCPGQEETWHVTRIPWE